MKSKSSKRSSSYSTIHSENKPNACFYVFTSSSDSRIHTRQSSISPGYFIRPKKTEFYWCKNKSDLKAIKNELQKNLPQPPARFFNKLEASVNSKHNKFKIAPSISKTKQIQDSNPKETNLTCNILMSCLSKKKKSKQKEYMSTSTSTTPPNAISFSEQTECRNIQNIETQTSAYNKKYENDKKGILVQNIHEALQNINKDELKKDENLKEKPKSPPKNKKSLFATSVYKSDTDLYSCKPSGVVLNRKATVRYADEIMADEIPPIRPRGGVSDESVGKRKSKRSDKNTDEDATEESQDSDSSFRPDDDMLAEALWVGYDWWRKKSKEARKKYEEPGMYFYDLDENHLIINIYVSML